MTNNTNIPAKPNTTKPNQLGFFSLYGSLFHALILTLLLIYIDQNVSDDGLQQRGVS